MNNGTTRWDRSDDRPHHVQTLSYVSIPCYDNNSNDDDDDGGGGDNNNNDNISNSSDDFNCYDEGGCCDTDS